MEHKFCQRERERDIGNRIILIGKLSLGAFTLAFFFFFDT